MKTTVKPNHSPASGRPNTVRCRRPLVGLATLGRAAEPTPASTGSLSYGLNVRDCGAVGDGSTHDTAAFQYRGSTLLAVEGRGQADGEPFLFLHANSVLKGVTIFYPEQDAQEPVPYPWCVRGIGDNFAILDVLLVNPWNAVDFGTFPCGRHLIRGLYGQPLNLGIFVDQCLDVGRIEDVHFWPFWTDALIPVTQKAGVAKMMDDIGEADRAKEYRDSAKGNTVDYIDSEAGNYAGFYWGIPGNLEDVPDDYNFQSYGADEFPYYCNGCIFPQDTVTAIMALSSVGMNDKADIIRRQIFRRQHEGFLPNGSGLYMGVVNVLGQCYSIIKWDDTPTDYEGIISRDCSFLQSAILIKDAAHALFDEATKTRP